MKQTLKKGLTGLLAAVLCLSVTACGDTSYSMKLGDITVPTGVYVLSKIDAVSEATTHEDFDSELEKPLENVIEEQPISAWIDREAEELTKEFLYVEEKFAEAGMELSEDDLAAAKNTVDSLWSFYQENYEKIGIAQSSYLARIQNSYKSRALFLAQYGKGGTEAVAEADLKAELKNNYAEVQLLSFSTNEEDGTAMTEANKQTVKKEAQSYLDRVEKGEDIVALINEKKEAEATEDAPANIDETADYKETIHNGTATATVSEALSKEIFEKAKAGTPALLSDESAYYVVLRHPSDTSKENFEEMYDTLVFDVKGEAYKDVISAAAKELKPELNANVVKTFSAKKLMGL